MRQERTVVGGKNMNIAGLFDLTGRTALVTGGNSGIGEAMARALGLAGAKLVLVARREEALREAADRFRAEGVNADILPADLSSPESALACGRKALEAFGPMDILVNAAGVNLRQPFMEITPETWSRQIMLHLTVPFFLTQALAPVMAERKWGRIINIASLQSFRAFANSAPYGAGKGRRRAAHPCHCAGMVVEGRYLQRRGPGLLPHRPDQTRVFRSGTCGAQRGADLHRTKRRSGGSVRLHGVSGQRGSLVHHRTDHHGRWRFHRTLTFCNRFGVCEGGAPSRLRSEGMAVILRISGRSVS